MTWTQIQNNHYRKVGSIMLFVDCFNHFITNVLDIDECEIGTDGCEQVCINIPGTFYCNCSEGYLLNDDGFSCEGEIIVEESPIECDSWYYDPCRH